MDTHENHLPDDQLPGHGIFAPEFIRQQLADAEQAGILLWDDEAESYRESAKAVLGKIGVGVMAAAAEIDPEASPEAIMQTVADCLPWHVGVGVGELPEGVEPLTMPNPDELDLPDTFPSDWAGEA